MGSLVLISNTTRRTAANEYLATCTAWPGQALYRQNDRLSDLGLSQAEDLADFWLERGIRPDSVFSGSMIRQRQTTDAVGKLFMTHGEEWPDLQENIGLNEYPAKDITESLVSALRNTDSTFDRLAADLESSKTHADKYRHLHRLKPSSPDGFRTIMVMPMWRSAGRHSAAP